MALPPFRPTTAPKALLKPEDVQKLDDSNLQDVQKLDDSNLRSKCGDKARSRVSMSCFEHPDDDFDLAKDEQVAPKQPSAFLSLMQGIDDMPDVAKAGKETPRPPETVKPTTPRTPPKQVMKTPIETYWKKT